MATTSVTISRLIRFAGRKSPLVSSSSAAVFPVLEHEEHHQHQHKQGQRRSFWMDVVRIKPQRQDHRRKGNNNNNKALKAVHEDPEQVVRRHRDETRSDGESLLDLMFHNDRHEKAWKKRQRLEGIRRYEFDKKHVTDLAKYIAFVQEHKETTK
mmetsp:Transcript_14433/g.29956  ORF Transcript_14433/g.29956 Transcript_14433/m.29956 type:complete len:154 (+) Transcript_14433:158-619(+)